jgi:tetratricopeptide (TPR) repeat protein
MGSSTKEHMKTISHLDKRICRRRSSCSLAARQCFRILKVSPHLLALAFVATLFAMADLPSIAADDKASTGLTTNQSSKVNLGVEFAQRNSAPTLISMPPVREYTETALVNALREKLSPDDLNLVVNPLLGSPELTYWAKQLTVGATNDEEKARLIFEPLDAHAHQNGQPTEGTMRTAREVFAAWKNPKTSFQCHDYAYLYVALARAVGLKAYDVYVQEDADGGKAMHACAAVNIGDKGILVDPSYYRFGVPHKRFIVLDDLRAIGLYMGQLGGLKNAEMAAKLASDIPLVQINLFDAIVASGDLKEGRKVMDKIKRSEFDEPTLQYMDGSLALLDGRTDEAITFLNKAIARDPNEASYYDRLARAYVEAGRPTEALDSLQHALRCFIMSADAQRIRSLILQSNALTAFSWCCLASKMQGTHDFDGALTNYDRAIKLLPDYAEAYAGRAYARQAKGDTEGASADYRHAISLKPDLASKAAP